MRIILQLFLLFVCIFPSPVKGEAGELAGSGTDTDPYLIENLTDLMLFSSVSCAHNYWQTGVHVRLTNDIAVKHSIDTALIAPDTKKGLPYSYSGIPYAGFFDGGGHTISNLSIVTDNCLVEYLGLFGKLTGTVENLKLKNMVIISRNSINYAGGICGLNEGGTISNCSVSGIIITKNNCYYLGGICGGNYGGMITNCHANSLIRTGKYCWYLGGLTGYNENGYISRCAAEFRISSEKCGMAIGGLCGGNTKSGFVSNCYSAGKIYCMKRNTFVGGLCGLNSHKGYILNSYSVGSIIPSDTIVHSGGLCGRNSSRIKNCFWDIDTSGIANSSGGIGLSKAEMLQQDTYANAGWSFASIKSKDAIWQTDEGKYPTLIPQQTRPTADLNSDGKVNMLDFGYISGRWLEDKCRDNNWCDGADLDMSGEIDSWDLLIVLDEWLE